MPDSEGLVSQDSFLEVTFRVTGEFAFDETYNTIERDEGSFLTDGFAAGMRIETGLESGNTGPFTILSVADNGLSMTLAEDVADLVETALTLTTFVPVAEVNSMNTPAGEPSEIDMSHLRSTAREFRNGLRDEGSISGEMNFVPADPGQVILTQMQGEKTGRTVRITVPPVDEEGQQLPGYQWTFTALARGMPVALATDEKATKSFTLRVSGSVLEELIEVED